MPHEPDETLEPTLPPAGQAGGSTPKRLGPYRLDGLLGRGGMGEVYRAWDEALQRPVAIKRVAVARQDHAEARARFWREARALAALDHPGVVRVHRIDETEAGELYLAMELVEGEPLAALMGSPWPSGFVAAIGRQAAAALGAVHDAGMTHRDVKPANILLAPDGAVRLVDFGLARRAEVVAERVTATGTRVGTPAYMAPEQVDGDEVGPCADVFALGVVLYRLLAGVHPFARDSESATALALASGVHRRLAAVVPDADPTLVALIERCLERAPEARFGNGDALAAALNAVPAVEREALAAFAVDRERAEASFSSSAPVVASVSGLAGKPRRTWQWVLGGAAVVMAGAWGWLAGQDDRRTPQWIDAARPAGSAPAPVVSALPPRPVVAVTGFAAPDDDPQDPRAAVLADALRHALEQVPQALVAVPLMTMQASLPSSRQVTPDLAPDGFTRPDRRLGHIDLFVRGAIADEGDGLVVEVELFDTVKREVLRSWTVEGPEDPIVAARVVAQGLVGILGSEGPGAWVSPTRSTSAYGALLASRAALRTGDFEAGEHNLKWALQLDPRFVEARLDELSLLRSRRQLDAVKAGAEALLLRPDLTARERALAEAWRARAQGDGPAALRALNELLEQWPYDIAAYDLLMALRSYDPQVRDATALEQLTRSVLAIAPRHETAASRLIRVLSWRDRVPQAEALLESFKVPRDDPGFAEVWGELDLYAGRFESAERLFRQALDRSPDNLYAEHMLFAAQILDGRCDAAAVGALDRIQRIDALGRDGNLDWTYSLASQALICQQQWASARRVMTRWAERFSSGRDQVLVLRPRVDLLTGAKDVAQTVVELLDGEVPARVRPELLRLLARVGTDVDDLRRRAAMAQTTAMDPDTLPTVRATWLRTRRTLELRADLLEGHEVEATLAGYAALYAADLKARDEGELGRQVEALALHAEALEHAGRAAKARPIWARITALGYPRLYATDLWLLATRAQETD